MADLDKGLLSRLDAFSLSPIYFLAPLAGQILRPLAKTVIKGGVMAYDWTASTATEAMQGMRDTMNEAAAERPR